MWRLAAIVIPWLQISATGCDFLTCNQTTASSGRSAS
nr:MAG TPA: hypothetical protein [Caudoviricetes sp.]